VSGAGVSGGGLLTLGKIRQAARGLWFVDKKKGKKVWGGGGGDSLEVAVKENE